MMGPSKGLFIRKFHSAQGKPIPARFKNRPIIPPKLLINARFVFFAFLELFRG